MSQPYQSPTADRPVLAPGGRATLWCAPRGLTGYHLRTALSSTLPTGLRAAVLAPAVVLPAVGAGVGEATDGPLVFALALVAGSSRRWPCSGGPSGASAGRPAWCS
jgi:hypothetical protein